MNDVEVLIVGGGISGLATAWWLKQYGIEVEVWEAEAQPGGKICSTREDGYLTERAAGLLVNFRPEIDQLLREAGLDSCKQARRENIKRYIIHQGSLAEVPMKAPAFFRSPLWSLSVKLRLLAEILIPRGDNEQETVSSFITRRFGREVLERAIDPFVAGTLASDPDTANAQAVLPRLTALERRYGSITMGMLVNCLLKRRRANNAETFTFRHGMSELIQALAAPTNRHSGMDCRNPDAMDGDQGVNLRCGIRVTGISRQCDGWRVTAETGSGICSLTVPRVVFCTPADITSSIIAGIDHRLSALLREIDYAPIAVLHLGLNRKKIRNPLDGTGFLVPRGEKIPFNGNLWMSSLFPERAPLDKVLLTTYLGGFRHPEQIEQDDQWITETVLSRLTPLLDIQGVPEYVRVDRHFKGLPLYHGNYSERIHNIRRQLQQLPGLYLSANYLDGVSVRERIYQGRQTAQQISDQQCR